MLTDPADAKRFCDALDLAAFACAVGTAHGFYHGEPKVDFDRIEKINSLTHTPMALHGGTGLSTRCSARRSRAARGKINISTNLKHVFVESFVDYHTANPKDFEPLRLIDAQYQACKAMFAGFIEKFGGKDRAQPLPRQSRLKRMLKAIIFDCDGVLVDTERDGHRVGFNRAFEAVRHRRRMGRAALRQAAPGRRRQGAHARLFRRVRLAGGQGRRIRWPRRADPGAAQDQDRDHRRLVSEGALPLRPGIARIVDEALAADVMLGVCTTSNPRFIDAVLDLFGPERKARFGFVHAGDVVSPARNRTPRSTSSPSGRSSCRSTNAW